jgi:hypothetical protein
LCSSAAAARMRRRTAQTFGIHSHILETRDGGGGVDESHRVAYCVDTKDTEAHVTKVQCNKMCNLGLVKVCSF